VAATLAAEVTMALHSRFEDAAAHYGGKVAVEDPGGHTLTYAQLDALSDRVRDRLHALGVRTGDRVGVHLPKSVDTVAAILGILKSGAAYVPVDADSPLPRAAFILNDCAVRAVFGHAPRAAELQSELGRLGAYPAMIVVGSAGGLSGTLADEDERSPSIRVGSTDPGADSLAYILYTSGSTGRPKGVMLTHRCAESYVDWCQRTFRPTRDDRFSSHAPFHFDLSILDLYVPLGCGATLVLVTEELGKDPRALAPFIAEKRISVWYSVPSILSLLGQYGKVERYDFGALRLVLFAGEVFPIAQLRALQARWPAADYYNLYGPTETNVCTYYRVEGMIAAERVEPLPIGRACEHLSCRVIDENGRDVEPGAEGELVVSGPAVMVGYWNLAEQNRAAFIVGDDGRKWYRTGDLVVEDPAVGYVFHGRRDRMVKRRGYRIELGEIEAGLSTHPAIREVAVVALRDEESGVRIKAVLSTRDGARLSLVELKQFSVDHLPRYMVPDLFEVVGALPRTSTDKIDYRAILAGG
jgi:amino acid adenylation domain-containing protein